ncbi:hypothetical protein PCA20602_00337 [Pandoraea capi]|uniref:Uncharacterized protein n=1 Tax=Pandoraea capi TaxID=2508286 RepID=A0ABY6VUU5_9BURK|nr:hypothetical protein [Pandoraea capi]VVD65602.1 hypothetical protein PCA20602_00337 [Pandoraea capi]
MPVNTEFIDARSAEKNLIRRVICDLRKPAEREAFLQALETAIMTQPPHGLVYIASIEVSPNDLAAAERIAWLRANAFTIDSTPTEQDIVGALGEWALLRVLALHSSVKPVSLVSLAPESRPDFVVRYTGFEALFDIKTTASPQEPSAYIDPVLHEKKGTPHVIGIRLSDKLAEIPKLANVYFIHSKSLITPVEYEEWCTQQGGRPRYVLSIKGYPD